MALQSRHQTMQEPLIHPAGVISNSVSEAISDDSIFIKGRSRENRM